jgi:hypothetical protein
MHLSNGNALKQYVWLVLFPILATSLDPDARDQPILQSAACVMVAGKCADSATIRGNGGVGGKPNVNIYITPQSGAGGNGGGAIGATPCGKTPRRIEGGTQLNPRRPFDGSPC